MLNVLSPYRLQCRTTLQVAARAVARLLAISCPNWQHEQRVIQRKRGLMIYGIPWIATWAAATPRRAAARAKRSARIATNSPTPRPCVWYALSPPAAVGVCLSLQTDWPLSSPLTRAWRGSVTYGIALTGRRSLPGAGAYSGSSAALASMGQISGLAHVAEYSCLGTLLALKRRLGGC